VFNGKDLWVLVCRGQFPSLGELIYAEHELHWIRRRLVDHFDQPVIDVKCYKTRRPLGGVGVRLDGMDGNLLAGEVIGDGGISERVEAHPDASGKRVDVTSENLANANFGRAARFVFIANHPKGYHVRWVIDCASLKLKQAVLRCIELNVLLLFAHDKALLEPMLADDGTDRSGEKTGLK